MPFPATGLTPPTTPPPPPTQARRPCFIVDNHKFVSAGIIPFTKLEDDSYRFMMQQRTTPVLARARSHSWSWEDFGGKSDACDLSILDTAVRECHEELNYHFTKSFIVKQLSHENSFRVMIPDSKYMVYFMYLDPIWFTEVSTKIYGTVERACKINRLVKWIDVADFMLLISEKQTNPRLNRLYELIKTRFV